MVGPDTDTPPLAALLKAPAAPDDPFGIYVHIPFCAHICPYCDFNTYANQSSRIPNYVDSICREMDVWSPMFGQRLTMSIFLGGGTPSLLEANQIGAIISSCRQKFNVSSAAEITIEANPNDVTAEYCVGLLEAGVRRISIGAQTLDRRGLRVLGRLHEADHVASAVAASRAAGFTNVSLDFIYGWPGQSIESWRKDLELVLSGAVGGSRPDHLSLYGLIVEPGTPMADAVKRGILSPIEDDASADYYELAIAVLSSAGWSHYEIANWSSGSDKASIHNSVYWRNGDYAGIGAGAHGHVHGRRVMNQPSPGRYIDMIQSERSPATNTETIDPRTAMSETMMLGLRLLESGVSSDAFLHRHGLSLKRQFGAQIEKLESLGMLSVSDERVRLTARGMMLANSVCAEFLSD